ncbi:MAG: inositol monophosphatase [Pirellulales bacterium]|nr:inositol monophosphatase [Pirellulales bacterium]
MSSQYLKVCREAVSEAGEVLMDRLGQVRVQAKGRADLVTEADFAAQEVVRQKLFAAFPEHTVLGEEDPPEANERYPRSDYRWILDPLDGTTNYVHQVPHFSVSLALEHRGELLVGAVYNPAAGEFFTAAAGEGAFLNDRPIRTSRVISLSEGLAAVGFPAVVTRDSPDLRLFLAALETCQAIRRTGSAALNLCYVAAGRFDVSWSYCTKVWDVAAGILMVREAGGVTGSTQGGVFSLDVPQYFVAATPELYTELRELAATAGLL